MEGYDVVTTGDEKLGKVVGTHGDYLIIEQGTFRKSKHAVPLTFATVKEAEQVVCVTLSKEILHGSPAVNGEFDETGVAAYYGLAEGSDAPLTEGWGETISDDPAEGSETQAERDGVPSPQQQRAEVREQLGSEESQGVPGSSPALLGDRHDQTKEDR